MLFQQLVNAASYLAVFVLGLLLLANIIILSARLFHRRDLANRLADFLLPIVRLFRVGLPPNRSAR